MTVAPTPSGYHGSRFFAWPASQLGRRAVLVAAATLGWFAVLLALGVLGVPDWGWAARLTLGISGLLAAIAAASSGVAAVIALVRGERSIALVLPLLFGAFWTMLIVGELVFEH
ncbi:MAG TPA: hypothetical protein VFU99_10905 [Gaiellaceae bacterium]|nr:hypothetical protein [Gaiellaceae bacterium]